MDQVAIAIVWNRGQVLVGRRPPGKLLAGFLEFPGGKSRPGESLAHACVRECREETGLDVTVLGLRAQINHRYDHGEMNLHFFDCALVDASRESERSSTYDWMDPATLRDTDFPPANQRVLAEIRLR